MLADMPNAMDGLYDIGDGPEGPTPMDRLQVETLNGPKNLVWVDYPSRCVFENHYANEVSASWHGSGVSDPIGWCRRSHHVWFRVVGQNPGRRG